MFKTKMSLVALVVSTIYILIVTLIIFTQLFPNLSIVNLFDELSFLRVLNSEAYFPFSVGILSSIFFMNLFYYFIQIYGYLNQSRNAYLIAIIYHVIPILIMMRINIDFRYKAIVIVPSTILLLVSLFAMLSLRKNN